MHRKFLPAPLTLMIACFWGVLGGVLETSHCQAESSCTHAGGYWVLTTYGMPQEAGACPQHIRFQCYHQPVNGRMQKSSLPLMQQSLDPYAPTCVFVHGSFVDMESALNDASHTYRWLRQGTNCRSMNIIFFVWPSSDAQTILLPTMVIENGLKAAHNGTFLAYLLDCLPATSPVSLVGHSHGTRVIAAGLHFRAGGEIQGRVMNNRGRNPRRIRVVFAAAAINNTWLNPDNRYGLALSQTEALLNLINNRDAALTLYPLVSPTYGRSFAKSNVVIFNRQNLGPHGAKVHDMNVAPLVGARHIWEAYYSQPQLARMIAPFILFQDQPRVQAGIQQVLAELTPEERSLMQFSDLPEVAPVATTAAAPIELPLPEMLSERPIISADVPRTAPVSLETE